jgi:hypothetical protein
MAQDRMGHTKPKSGVARAIPAILLPPPMTLTVRDEIRAKVMMESDNPNTTSYWLAVESNTVSCTISAKSRPQYLTL